MTPVYLSTRGSGETCSFGEALLAGLAPDGGLYIPDTVPQLEPALWQSAPTFLDVAVRILSAWVGGGIEADAGAALVREALNFEVPLVSLPDPPKGLEEVHVLELYHGPTLSFKDFGARTMARWMGYFLKQQNRRLTILVATSGDTGSAVADGFAGQEAIDVVLLYPKGQVSAVQEQQLIVARPGVRTFAVSGTFDDCQRMVKAAFVDPALAHLPLSSANSINIGRLLPQSLYYLWAARWFGGQPFNFCTPSGNLGNLTGGVLAARMGVPVHRFLAAHNANGFFPAYLHGEAHDFRPSVRTVSNAMDVGAPSNFERLQALFTPEAMPEAIWGTSISDPLTKTVMRRVYESTGYIADPHTSVGLAAVQQYRQETGDPAPVVVLSTAHPAKFPDTVSEVLGIDSPRAEALEKLWAQPVRVEPLAPTAEALREKIVDC